MRGCWRERGRPGLAPSSVLAYLAQAAEALTHLHSQDPPVIHGDVKPANLILTKGGRVKLVDFGMSSAPDAPRRRTGTPGYRAPELAADGVPSRASDVYALAATAFALLSGSPPSGVLPSWDGIEPAQAEQLEAALRLGLATDPARRPATPGELVESLRSGWGAALPTGVMTFCLSDIEGSAALWDGDPAAMAEALVRHDEIIAAHVEARGGRFLKSMGEGDSHGVGVRVGASGPGRGGCRHPCPAGGIVARRATSRGSFRAAHRRSRTPGSGLLRADPQRGRAAARAGGRRPDLRLRGDGRARRRATSRPAASSSTSVRTGCAGSAGRSASTPSRDQGSARRCPRASRRIAVCSPSSPTTGGSSSAVSTSSRRSSRDSRPAGCWRSSAPRAAASRRSCGPASPAPCSPARSRESSARGSSPQAPSRGSSVTDDPRELVVVDQFEELYTLCEDPARRDAFIDRLLALAVAGRDRRARRPVREVERPRGPGARGRGQSDPARGDGRRGARARHHRARTGGRAATGAGPRGADPARCGARARSPAAALACAARDLGAARRAHPHGRGLPLERRRRVRDRADRRLGGGRRCRPTGGAWCATSSSA